MTNPQPTACIVIIGNEILSGRTHDTNTHWLAGQLTTLGIRVAEARVIPDIKQTIIDVVGQVAKAHDYVFTTGGIGPTHDDITAESVAALFSVKLVLHPEAEARLKAHYGDQLNEARLKMGYVPAGATLIDNPVSAAPGFCVKNVYVMAGIPSIMRAMFDGIKGKLKGGAPTLSLTVSAAVTEGIIATQLSEIQKKYAEVDIGSYPFIKDGKLGVSIVLRGLDLATLEKAASEVRVLLASKGDLFDSAGGGESMVG
jgi:molybdenum cofactor synthesis domain-containing protein